MPVVDHCILVVQAGVFQSPMVELGKLILGLGILLVFVGAVVLLAGRIGLPLGRLPGDISYRGKNVSFFVPLGTSILISVVLSVIFYLISRFRR